MTNRIKVYIGILAFLGLAMIGGGLWFLLKPSTAIEIPEGEPVVWMSKVYRIVGAGPDQLRIYEDGTVIHSETTETEFENVRKWCTGQLNENELNELLALFDNDDFKSLDSHYEFPGETVNGMTKTGGKSYTISVNYQNLQKSVSADWYISSDDMPYPLNKIYAKLADVIENRTEEVYKEAY